MLQPFSAARMKCEKWHWPCGDISLAAQVWHGENARGAWIQLQKPISVPTCEHTLLTQANHDRACGKFYDQLGRLVPATRALANAHSKWTATESSPPVAHIWRVVAAVWVMWPLIRNAESLAAPQWGVTCLSCETNPKGKSVRVLVYMIMAIC